MTKTICLAILFLGLCACASAPLVVEGRYLQSGPADAPWLEIPLESKGTCEFILKEFPYRARKLSRCAASSADLAFKYEAKIAILGVLPVYARNEEACERFRKTDAEGKYAEFVSILTECHKS